MADHARTGRMLISKADDRWKDIDAAKVASGTFLTTGATWLLPQVRDFIVNRNPSVILDPFAGKGDLLRAVEPFVSCPTIGYDIAPEFGWPLNDSLKSIPKHDKALILTNPPYLAKHSAKRKRVHDAVSSHFDVADDLYKVALLRCLETATSVVAIVPETFINSDFPKNYCHSISIVLNNPFSDTECPVCVVCFSTELQTTQEATIYVDEVCAGQWLDLHAQRLIPNNQLEILFNKPDGRLALKAVDGVRPDDRIRFLVASEFAYSSDIKHSSRLMTRIEIPVLSDTQLCSLVDAANQELDGFRTRTRDVLLSPFKGNTHTGTRRRRLDYFTARALLENAYEAILPKKKKAHQQRLPGFN